ncbi:hypothetical protein QEN19_000184 [Hanseniaspora menglaensis]
MDIEDLLADLQQNSTTIHGRTTLNNSLITSEINTKSFDATSEDPTNGISTGQTTHLNTDNDESYLKDHQSTNENVYLESFVSKSEKNKLDIEAFMQLTTSWRNERMSPELLPFNERVFNLMTENMKRQIEYIDYWNMLQESETDTGATNEMTHEQLLLQKRINKLPLHCMEAELERVKFLLRSYLRCRLQKIDKFLLLLQETDQIVFDEVSMQEKSILVINKLLSEPEYRYFQQKAKITARLLSNTVLLNLPENFQQINDESSTVKMIQEPDLEQFVFIFVKGSDQKNSSDRYKIFNIETQEEVELVVGGIYVMRYDLIESFVKDGTVILI